MLLLLNLKRIITLPQSRYEEKLLPGSSHQVIIDKIAGSAEIRKILDIGIGSGILGRRFSSKEYEIYGVEPDPVWANEAGKYYKDIFVGTLKETPLDFFQGVDLVVCADVLEHMADPKSALKLLVSTQEKGTYFIISVPNIANIWIRLNLLFGKFDYAEKGILDHTHLKFFTKKSFKALLEEAGLGHIEIIPTPLPLELVSSFFSTSKLGRGIYFILLWLTKCFPTLLGYQFVCFAEG